MTRFRICGEGMLEGILESKIKKLLQDIHISIAKSLFSCLPGRSLGLLISELVGATLNSIEPFKVYVLAPFHIQDVTKSIALG